MERWGGNLERYLKLAFVGRAYRFGSFEEQRKAVMLNVVLLICTLYYGVFAINTAAKGAHLVSAIEVTLQVVAFASYLAVIFWGSVVFFGMLNFALASAFFLYMFSTGGIDGSGYIWQLILPLIVYFVMGMRKGSILVGGLYGASLFIYIARPFGLYTANYNKQMMLRFFFVYAMIVVVAAVFESVRRNVQDRIEQKNRELETAVISLEQQQEKIKQLAFFDTLTGLHNRTMLLESLHLVLERMKRDGGIVAVLFVDLDRFKTINDSMGHETGDMVLKHVGRRLRNLVRKSDIVARWGGDEFILVLPKITRQEHASVVARKVLERLSAPFEVDGAQYYISCTIGICTTHDGAIAPSDLLKNADTAMYRGKSQGKGIYCHYDKKIDSVATRWMQTEQELRAALELGQFHLAYQPLMALNDRTVVGMEALIRWTHPSRGLVSPADFIPVAEETGLIVPIGAWVLDTAIAFHVRCRDELKREISISVNISPRQLRSRDIHDQLARLLEKHRINPRMVELEVTEGVIVGDDQFVHKLLSDLKALGVRLAIDDFGTGYSSFSRLKSYQVDTLKIDRSFVSEMETDEEQRAIVRSIILMANALKLKTVAEGVELAEQAEGLAELGCCEAQGFYFSKPLPEDKFAEWLAPPSLLRLKSAG